MTWLWVLGALVVGLLIGFVIGYVVSADRTTARWWE